MARKNRRGPSVNEIKLRKKSARMFPKTTRANRRLRKGTKAFVKSSARARRKRRGLKSF